VTVFALKPANKLPVDLPGQLRALADRIEAGEVTAFVAAMAANGNYEFLFASPDTDNLVLASLLQARCIERFRE